MKTSERIAHIAQLFQNKPRYGFASEKDIRDFLAFELGSELALDSWIPAPGGLCRAIAPEKIYIICAGNLSVSAEMTLILGLLLGSELFFKLPSEGLPDFEKFAASIPDAFSKKIHLLKQHEKEILLSCEGVIVFGSDETVAEIRTSLHWKQKLLAYGHKVSFGIIDVPEPQLASCASRAADEICIYDQSGCLSPQAYLCTSYHLAESFALALSHEMKIRDEKNPRADLDWTDAAHIFTARQDAHARGDQVWESAPSPDWTVALRNDSRFDVGPGNRFIQVSVLDREWLLQNWSGHISSISLETISFASIWEDLAIGLGASRLCRVGELQHPHLAWRHDGRPRVGDLVHWIFKDC